MSPVLIVLAIFYYMSTPNSYGYIILCIIAIALIIFILYFPKLSLKTSSKNHIKASKISPNDSYYSYLFTYWIPFLTIFLNIDLTICTSLIVIVTIALYVSNSSIPNPLLRGIGYHFYTIDLEDGMSGYTLITKKRLYNCTQISCVCTPLEFLLIEAEE